MSKDFRIKQLRTSQVIVSGSNVGTSPSMLIYSSSAATNVSGGTHADLLTGVGKDVWLFVSGSKGVEANTDETVLFGGNVTHSGSLELKDGLTIKHASGGKITLQSSDTTITAGSVLGRMEFEAPDEASGTDALQTAAEISAVAEETFTASSNATKLSFKTGASEAASEKMSLSSVGDLTVSGDVRVSGNNIKDSSGNSVIAFNGDATTTLAGDLNIPGNIKRVGDADTKIALTSDMLAFTAGNVEGLRIFEGANDWVTVNNSAADLNFQVKTPNQTGAIFVNAGQDSIVIGENSVADIAATDTKILFGGVVGSKDTATRGTSVFKGDLVVSGTLYAERQVMEVDLTKTGHLVMSGAVNFKNQTAGGGGAVVVPLNDGAVFAATGSMVGKVVTSDGTEEFKLKEYLPGTGINVIGSTIGSRATVKADPTILAHLTGAFFSSNVGVTGSFGVSNNVAMMSGKYLYLNGEGGDSWIRGGASNLTIDGDDNVVLNADVGVILRGGPNSNSSTDNTFMVGTNNITHNFGNLDVNHIFKTNNHTTMFIDGNDESVIIGADRNLSHASEMALRGYGTDVKIMLSGSAGAKSDTAAEGRGVVLLPGDVVVSGSTYLRGETNFNDDASLISGKKLYFNNPGDKNIFIEATSENNMLIDADSTLSVNVDGTYSVNIGGDHSSNSNIFIASANSWMFNKYKLDVDFSVNTDDYTGTLFIDGNDNSVIIGAQNFDSSPLASELKAAHGYGDDVKIMLSGSAGSKSDTAAEGRGVVLVPGDLVVSGSSYHTADVNLLANSRLRLNNPGENDQFIYGNNSTVFIDGDNFIYQYADLGVSSYVGNSFNSFTTDTNEFNTNRADVDFEVNTDDYYATLLIDGNDNTIILGHEGFDDTPSAAEADGYGADVKIMISGSAGSKSDTAAHGRGVVLLPGDVVISGSLSGPGGTSYLSNANEGLNNNSGTAQLSLNSLSAAAAVAVGDSFAFIDADDSNATKKGTIASLVTAVAGDGLVNQGNQLQVGVDGSTIERNGDALRIKDDGVTAAKLNSDVAGTGLEQHSDGTIRVAAAAAGNGLAGGAGSALTVDLETNGGLKFKASNNKLQTDDSKVAHLSGSVFTGGVTFKSDITAETHLLLAGEIRHLGDTDTKIRFTDDAMSFSAGNLEGVVISEAGASSAVQINPSQTPNLDFFVKSDNEHKMIFVNSGFDYISIGDDANNGEAGKGVNSDNHLFVSGAIGGVTAQQGVSVFGGDLVVSGTIYDKNHNPIGEQRSFKENGTFGAGTGNAPAATGTDAVAIGLRSSAAGNYSLAIGSSENNSTDATANHSLAIGGDDATASGAYASAIGGSANTAAGQYSVAMGRNSSVTGDYSVAIGDTLTTYDARTTIFGSSGSPASAKTLLSSSLEVNQTTLLQGNVTLGDSATLTIPSSIVHKSDVNTHITFNNDRIRLTTDNKTDLDITSNQVIVSPGGQNTPANANGLDVAFYVSGSVATQGTNVRATALFGGDVHISGSLSGPASYELTNSDVRIFRDGNLMKFDDGANTVKTLSQLAAVGISDESTFFQGVHAGSNNAKMATSASVSFAGTQGVGHYVENLGADVYMYVSGGLRSDTAAYGKTTAVFGGATVFSGSADYLGPVSFNTVSAASVTGSQSVTTALIADTAGNPALSISSQKLAMGPNIVPAGANSALFTLQKNSATQAGTSNNNSDFQLLLKNIDDGDNSFSGIAFDSGNETDPDSIGAAIRAERDSSAGSNMTLHDMNLTFATNDAGDGGLTERMRVTHDGKVGIGIATPSRALDVNGDIHVRGGDILFANNQNATISIADVAGTNTAGKNLTISGGPSTGNAAGGSINFNLAVQGSSGDSVNAASTTILSLSPVNGTATFAGNIKLPNDDGIKNADGNTVLTVRGNSDGNGIQIPGGDLELNQSGTATIIIGDNSDGNDRSISFGHSTLQTRLGIDDSADVFAINTDQNFESGNDFEIDASGNVTLGNGDLYVRGGDIYGIEDGQLRLHSDTDVIVKLDADDDSTSAFKINISGDTTKFEVNESGDTQMDGVLVVDGTGNSSIAGNLDVADRIRHIGDADTQVRFPQANQVSIEAGGLPMALFNAVSSPPAVVFNEASGDHDFRVESNSNVNMLFVDGSTDRVGIGTNNPISELDVNGKLTVQGNLRFDHAHGNTIFCNNEDHPVAFVDNVGNANITLGINSETYPEIYSKIGGLSTKHGLQGTATALQCFGAAPHVFYEGPLDTSNTNYGTGGDFSNSNSYNYQVASATAGLFVSGKPYFQTAHSPAHQMTSNLLSDKVNQHIKFKAALGDGTNDSGVNRFGEPTSGEKLLLEYSTNGSGWTKYTDTVISESALGTGAWTNCTIMIPAGTVGSAYRIRMRAVQSDNSDISWGGTPANTPGFLFRAFRITSNNSWYTIEPENAPNIALWMRDDAENLAHIETGAHKFVNFYLPSGTEIGTISTSDASTVTYGAFTGVHYGILPDGVDFKINSLVKINSTTETLYTGNEPVYNVSYTGSPEDKASLGVVVSKIKKLNPKDENDFKHFVQIASVGNGKILVSSDGGNIEIGDYLCSGLTTGAAQKQSSDQLHNYTVAKATEPVDWANEFVYETIVSYDDENSPNPTKTTTVRKKLDSNGDPILATTKVIACTFHAG